MDGHPTPERSGFFMSKITYTLVGDYLLPNITLREPPPNEVVPLGRYARMRRAFLREHLPIQYNRLLLSEQLFFHLREIDEICEERRRRGVSEGIIVKEIVCEYLP
jgi:hypothetical protein